MREHGPSGRARAAANMERRPWPGKPRPWAPAARARKGPVKRFLLTGGALAAFLLLGGALLGVLGPLGLGDSQPWVVAAVAALFQVAAIWLFIDEIRKALSRDTPLWPHLAGMVGSVALLLLGFAWAYSELGLVDTTRAFPTTVHAFPTALYFSVITFSTVGYGDIRPDGVARALAAVQGLGGYVVLGILVSSGFAIIRRSLEEEGEKEERREAAEAGEDRDGGGGWAEEASSRTP